MIKKTLAHSSLILAVFLLPMFAMANESYCPDTFQNIPFLTEGSCSTEVFVNALYQLAIALGATLVVLRFIWAGAQYMLSDMVTKKEKAKDQMKASLLGLIIILAAVTILNTINPQLTELNFLRGAPNVNVNSAGGNSNYTYVNSLDEFRRGTVTMPPCDDNSYQVEYGVQNEGVCSTSHSVRNTYEQKCRTSNPRGVFGSFTSIENGVRRDVYHCF